jgi:hypothetical protein
MGRTASGRRDCETGAEGQNVLDKGANDHRRNQVKGHDEKCAQSKRRAKPLVPTKKAVADTKEVIKAADYATTETPKADRAEVAEIRKLICQASGIRGERAAERILSQMDRMQLWRLEDANGGERALAALEMLIELKPANVMEAMLSVQMVGVHDAALMFLRRATIEGQTFEGCDADALRATRLLRLFNEQLEAMAKLKGKARQQKVTVEHVHVYQGGQAIVGAVNAGTEGPGEGTK